MTELEKAKQLKALFIEHKNLFERGFCKFLTTLLENGIIGCVDDNILIRFVKNHHPRIHHTKIRYSFLEKRNTSSVYYFKCGNYNRRLRWLNEIIKEYES